MPETLDFWVQRYGLTRWGNLFNPHQQLALIAFADKVRQAHASMLAQGANPEFAWAVTTYLALAVSRMADYMSNLCIHTNTQERTVHIFGKRMLLMVWDYSEFNPLSDTVGSWTSMLERRIFGVLAHLTHIPSVEEGTR